VGDPRLCRLKKARCRVKVLVEEASMHGLDSSKLPRV